ncbi:MAG: TA0956 family protein [Candidatus Thermoplasmatota archaeon]|jgi:hypothetical protein|nr:TA0956 family protein [Candidatus Thermoplasmatota archaeon]MCL5954974.1 TA0956 family protein [Candidatus Thermoplasmatota archaeon]
MYNLSLGSIHPSVICVELPNLIPSLDSLVDLLGSAYIEEGLPEFIENFSRTDEVLPTDKTVGFVVLNSNKKIVSFSFSAVETHTKNGLISAGEKFRQIGYSVDLDLP